MDLKKLFFTGLLLAVLITGLWLYANVSFPLTDVLPEGTWTKAQLWHYDENMNSREFRIDEKTLSQIIAALASARVSHRQRFDSMTQPNFQLYLYHSSGYPTSVTIVENGDIAIAIELDTDHYCYFDCGEELYEALYRICQQLPIKKNSSLLIPNCFHIFSQPALYKQPILHILGGIKNERINRSDLWRLQRRCRPDRGRGQ